MEKYASKFSFVVWLGNTNARYYIVDYKKDGSDSGLYMPGYRNHFGTSLAARGTREEIDALVKEHVPD